MKYVTALHFDGDYKIIFCTLLVAFNVNVVFLFIFNVNVFLSIFEAVIHSVEKRDYAGCDVINLLLADVESMHREEVYYLEHF